MSLAGQEAFAFESLINQQAVDSEFIDFSTYGLTSGELVYYNDPYLVSVTTGTGLSLTSGILSNTGTLAINAGLNITTSNATGIYIINTVTNPTFASLTLTGLPAGVLKSSNVGLITSNANTDDLTEGATNLYFTNNRARAAITAAAPIFATSGIISIGYNTTNLKLTGSNLDTIQDIATSSSPQFTRLLNSTLGNRTVLCGTNAGSSFTTGGTDCVAVGHNALSQLTTAGTSTAIGSQTLRYATTGGSNTAVGFNSLNALTTGNQNTALGPFTGSLITTGSFNTLIGLSAGYNITSGGTNYCLGLNAGYSITSSSDNITLGAYSMGRNLNPITITNGRNIAIGHYASHSLAGSPANNISIGYNSMYNATAPRDNICIGTDSGNSITTGGGNICIGGASTSTGGTLTSGNGYNVGVGIASNLYVSAGAENNIGLGAYSNFNTSTGNNNISIGLATQASTATSSNEITISTNGTISVPVSGRGVNTCLIDARAGLFSYSPAYCHLRSTAFNNGTVTWEFFNDGVRTYNNGFILLFANTLVVQPYSGVYEITVSGSALAQASLVAQINLVANNIRNYNIAYQSSSAINGYLVNVSGTQLSRPVDSVPANSGWFVNCLGARFYSLDIPLYMTIKFISL